MIRSILILLKCRGAEMDGDPHTALIMIADVYTARLRDSWGDALRLLFSDAKRALSFNTGCRQRAGAHSQDAAAWPAWLSAADPIVS